MFLKKLAAIIPVTLFSVAALAQIGTPVSINVTPTSIAQSSYTDVNSQSPGTSFLYTVNNSCEALGRITSTVELGMVSFSVFLENVAGIYNDQPFVGRYYDIHPSQNMTANTDLVLYFSQADFDAYNESPGVTTGAFPPIESDGSNLLITAYHGLSTDGTTGPNGQYNADNAILITPSVTLNSEGLFEVAFTTPGFSGFFAHTNNTGTPLDIQLSKLAAKNMGDINRIEWSTAQEVIGDLFEIERSSNGRVFEKIGSINAAGIPASDYHFDDPTPINGVNYYRLHLINASGSNQYSAIVSATKISGDQIYLTAFPNPFENEISVSIKGAISKNASLSVVNNIGQTLQTTNVASSGVYKLNTAYLSQGIYYIIYNDDVFRERIKIVKK